MAIINKILIKSRIKLVSKVVDEMIEKSMSGHEGLFYDFEEIKNSISKGVENKYLSEIEFIGRNNSEIFCTFSIAIDWKHHKVIFLADDKKYEFDGGGTSILEQVSKVAYHVSDLMNKEIRNSNINDLTVYYKLNDDLKDKSAAEEELGITDIDEPDLEKYRKFRDSSIDISIKPGNLPEMDIGMRKKKKG